MKRLSKSPLIVLYLLLPIIHAQPAYSQTRYCTPEAPFNCRIKPSDEAIEACRVELRHMTVLDYSMLNSKRNLVKIPSRLLLSQDGMEVYADTPPIGASLFLQSISLTGMKVVVVYQDEAVRQKVISGLRGGKFLPAPGVGALVDNLKYMVVTFVPDEVILNKPFEEKWYIKAFEYYQPKACVNIFQNDAPGFPLTPGIWITSIPIPDGQKLRPESNPLFAKILPLMLAWVKACAPLVGH